MTSHSLSTPVHTTAGQAVEVKSEARRRVEAHCQSLVDAGIARWHVGADDDGHVELHMNSGEAYLFDQVGVTRLR